MGFGIITVGFLSLLLADYALGAILAGPLLAYGLDRLAKYNKKFGLAVFPSVLMPVCGIIKFMFFFGFVGDIVNHISSVVFHLLCGFAVAVFLLGVKDITDSIAPSMSSRASVLLYINVLYFTLGLVEFISPMAAMALILLISKYIIIILNVLFAHRCFVKISTEEKTEQDIQSLIDEQEKRKQRKEKQEERLRNIRKERK